MANNAENAWCVSGPVASAIPAGDNWDYIFGETNNVQNFSVCTSSWFVLKCTILMKQNIFAPDFHSEGFDTIRSRTDDSTADHIRAASQSRSEVRRGNHSTRPVSTQCLDNSESRKFDCAEEPVPLGANSDQTLNTTLTASLNDPGVDIPGAFAYGKPPNLDGGSLNPYSATTGSPSFLLHGLSSMTNHLKNDRASPSTTYGIPFPTRLGSYDPMTASFTTLAVQDGSGEKWWHDTAQRPSDLGIFGDDLPDDLSSNAWPSESTLVPLWGEQQNPIDTVSPQALSLENSSASSFSSPTISSQQHSKQNSNLRSAQATSKASCDPSSSIHELPFMLRTRTRQKLPSEPTSRGHALILPKNDQGSSNGAKTRLNPSRARAHINHEAVTSETPQALRRIKPKTMQADVPYDVPENCVGAAKESVKVAAALHREARNEFLVGSRLMGIPYKEIRRQGGFTEAESTLRGRFRTLTKEKRERVRKPEWGERDVSR